MLTAYTVKPDGSIEAKELTEAMPYQDKRAVVGGLIQIVPEWCEYDGKPCIAYCNEEGLLEGLPFNKTANDMWTADLLRQFKREDLNFDMVHLVGNVLIITGDTAAEANGEEGEDDEER